MAVGVLLPLLHVAVVQHLATFDLRLRLGKVVGRLAGAPVGAGGIGVGLFQGGRSLGGEERGGVVGDDSSESGNTGVVSEKEREIGKELPEDVIIFGLLHRRIRVRSS